MKRKLIIILCLFIVLSGGTNVFALDIALTPREIDLGDGLVFWMTLPGHVESGYPASGLYQNEDLLYTVEVDGDWWWGQLYFSDDAMSFLFVPIMGESSSAIRFYNQGVFEHDFKVINLLEGGADSLIPPYELHTYNQWDFGEQRFYDRANNILQTTTAENVTITFDLSTGTILSMEKEQTQDNKAAIIVVVCVFVCTAAIIILFITKKKRLK